MALEFDPAVFDEKQGLLHTAYDQELYREVLEFFLEDAEESEKKLREYMDAGDLKNYEIVVHALKNNLRTVGAVLAGEAAYDMELHAKSRDLDYVKSHHEELTEKIEVAKKYIRQYLNDKV